MFMSIFVLKVLHRVLDCLYIFCDRSSKPDGQFFAYKATRINFVLNKVFLTLSAKSFVSDECVGFI